jgi:hypothetical protein
MQDTVNIKKIELPEIRKNKNNINNPIKRILEDKSNCINTIKKFFNEDEEKVKNLKFFNPSIFTIENKDKDILHCTSYELFSLQTIANINSKKITKKNKDNKNEKNKEESGKIFLLIFRCWKNWKKK